MSNLKTTLVLNNFKQYSFNVLGVSFLIGISQNSTYLKLNDRGFEVTTKPNFSIRNGYKKSVKIKNYYIVKL
jgi:hypothetical protein